MFITAVQPLSFYSGSQYFKPSFEGKKIIDLNYILKNRSDLLPNRIYEKVNEIVSSKSQKMPTLMQLHKEIYAPLMECKTLDEAKKIFPEFAGMKDANDVFVRNSGNIKKLNTNGKLQDNLSLKLLQEVWFNLKSQDEIAHSLGLKGRAGLGWIIKKIGFVNYVNNYRTLLLSSDPVSRAVIAAKTTAWNASHPDLMYQKNKHAAQFCKTLEYRSAQSKRIIEHDKSNPQRIEKIRKFFVEVWDKVPEVKKAMSEFAELQDPFTKMVIKKDMSQIDLNECEMRVKKGFYKKFWQTHPEMREKYKEAFQKVREERKLLNAIKEAES